ncbi:MAG: lipoate--protein ligase [Spirochaetales bacterium]|nr:lipoate--protein ligase [Spirochaetales bacterium]
MTAPDFLVFRSESRDIRYNLALEEYILNRYATKNRILFLWRNDSCVVIGRYQNPWAECDLTAMERDGVVLARRSSGGGAVYHDRGNCCFTLAGPKGTADKSENFELLLRALRCLGLEPELSGRNDIIIGGRKVSGSAFRNTAGYESHHGTMLIKTDLQAAGRYLTPGADKLQSKGVKSVESRIANLTDFAPGLEPEDFETALFREAEKQFGGDGQSLPEIREDAGLEELELRYASREWVFGRTPRFSNRISGRLEWGGIEVLLDVSGGRIDRACVYSDCLEAGPVEELQRLLPGLEYAPAAIRALGAGHGSQVGQALELIASAMEEK